MRQHASAYVRGICQHTSAYVSIRPHTSVTGAADAGAAADAFAASVFVLLYRKSASVFVLLY
jgi:hypothetical protein